jgi:hypothetical protein
MGLLRRFLIAVNYDFCKDYALFHNWHKIGGERCDYDTFRWIYRCSECGQTSYTYEPYGP